MYRSKEIRWFTRREAKRITQWFAGQGLTFTSVEARTDFYLPLPDRDDMSIKLREGNIEIKQRTGAPEKGSLTDNVAGYFENWVKWSFTSDKEDGLSNAIIHEKKFGWKEVYKERIGVKLTNAENGEAKIVNLNQIISSGCQVEYTRIIIEDEEWFTFALEWFGDEKIEIDPTFLESILGDSPFDQQDSKGYNQFLNDLKL
jgi:hypothetical protein